MHQNSSCEDIRELLSAMADDEIDTPRRKFVSAHLLQCNECSRDIGRMVAAKGLVQRDATDGEVPAGFMARVHDRLDEVSEVPQRVRRRVYHHPPARRVAGLAAAGAIAVSIAIIFSTVFFMRHDTGLQIAELHEQLSAGAPRVAAGASGDFTTVSRDPARESWDHVRQAIIQLDGTAVSYSLYRVGNATVSVFEGPYAWEPYRSGRNVTQHIGGFDVRQIGDQSMVTWRHSTQRYVLTANAPPEALPSYARAFMRSQGRSSGL